MSRLYGIVLLAALIALGVGLRQRALTRSDRISACDALAAARVQELGELLRARISKDDPPATRLARLAEQRGLRAIPGTGDDTSTYARDEISVYGLGLTSNNVDPVTGRQRRGWVLRAWPREFGVTGDLEFHVDDRGVIWHGQNEVGRSGTTEGFPPKFPAKELKNPRQAIWWHPAP